jgi:molybdate transport repressor ModE-like protein
LRGAGSTDNVRERKPAIRFCMDREAHWDLFRTFEAVARLGTITAAAKALGLSQSTASRHLARLEELSGSTLLLRDAPVRLTQRGEALLAALGPMVSAARSAQTALEAAQEPRGLVTITTVGEVVRWVLARGFASFAKSHPHIRLRILADNRVNSLAAGEADLAVRLVRPTEGDLVSKKLFTEQYAFFVERSIELGASTPWVGLTGSLADIPEQRHAERVFASRPARLLVEDVESLALAASAGLGVAILPKRLAARHEALVELQPEHLGIAERAPIASRDFWLVMHRSKQRVAKVRAVARWVEQCVHARTS